MEFWALASKREGLQGNSSAEAFVTFVFPIAARLKDAATVGKHMFTQVLWNFVAAFMCKGHGRLLQLICDSQTHDEQQAVFCQHILLY